MQFWLVSSRNSMLSEAHFSIIKEFFDKGRGKTNLMKHRSLYTFINESNYKAYTYLDIILHIMPMLIY